MISVSLFVGRPHALYHNITAHLAHLPLRSSSPGRSTLFQHNLLVPVRGQQGQRRQVQHQQVLHRNLFCSRWENIHAHHSLKAKRTLATSVSTTARKYSLMMYCRPQNGAFLDHVDVTQAHSKPSNQGCDARTTKQLSFHSPKGIHRSLCQAMGRARTNAVHSYCQ